VGAVLALEDRHTPAVSAESSVDSRLGTPVISTGLGGNDGYSMVGSGSYSVVVNGGYSMVDWKMVGSVSFSNLLLGVRIGV
jgi:hypothetical protein